MLQMVFISRHSYHPYLLNKLQMFQGRWQNNNLIADHSYVINIYLYSFYYISRTQSNLNIFHVDSV
jgi:hypothetical protein